MAMTLTSETETSIQRELERGNFQSEDHVVATALELLRHEQDILAGRRAEIEAKLDESVASVERGESVTFKELFATMDAWKAKL